MSLWDYWQALDLIAAARKGLSNDGPRMSGKCKRMSTLAQESGQLKANGCLQDYVLILLSVCKPKKREIESRNSRRI